MVTPAIQGESPVCAICNVIGHPTHICPELDELKPLLGSETEIMMPRSRKKEPTTKAKGKVLRTNHACTLCNNYGHYTHNFPEIPRYRDALHAIKRSYQENPSTQAFGNESRTILYLQEERRVVERPLVIPNIRFTLCDERGHFLEECVALELIHRWYPIKRVYYVRLREAQFTCPLCADKHLLDNVHYIPRFWLTLASLRASIVRLSQEDDMDAKSTRSSMTQEDVMSGSIMFLTTEEWPTREPLVTPNCSPQSRPACTLCKTTNHTIVHCPDLAVLRC